MVKIFLKRFKKQNIILSLIQQLSVDLKQDSAIKYRYLQDAVLSLGKVDPGDPQIRTFCLWRRFSSLEFCDKTFSTDECFIEVEKSLAQEKYLIRTRFQNETFCLKRELHMPENASINHNSNPR